MFFSAYNINNGFIDSWELIDDKALELTDFELIILSLSSFGPIVDHLPCIRQPYDAAAIISVDIVIFNIVKLIIIDICMTLVSIP